MMHVTQPTLVPSLVRLALAVCLLLLGTGQAKKLPDLERKSIVFDPKTPSVFYCPQEKPADPDKLIVKAQPLHKLCQFEGKPKPKGDPSDCYSDIDETQFACDEKRRFMIKMDIAVEYDDSEGIDDLEFILTKNSPKKRTARSGKRYLRNMTTE